MIDTLKVTGGDPEAMYFLQAWGKYLRAADNIVDDPDFSRERVCAALALGETTYASNFFRKHAQHLQMAILVGCSLWSIANEWEHSDEQWKKFHAEVLRNTDILMLNAVCQICVGWRTAGEASRALLSAGYANHCAKHGRIFPET